MDNYGFGFSVGIGGAINNGPIAPKKTQPIAIPQPKYPPADPYRDMYESKLMIKYAHLPNPIPYNYGIGHEQHQRYAQANNQTYQLIPPLNCSPSLWEEVKEAFGVR